MRERVTEPRLREFMRALAREAREEGRVFLTGGACAVLLGWRKSTLDVDLKIVPEDDRLLQAIPRLKESLHINVEQAAPDQFIPAVPGWQERSSFIAREGRLSFHHYDFYSQALAKIERGHEVDRQDVRDMIAAGLVEPAKLLELFSVIEPQLYRFTAINPAAFRRAVESLQ